MRLNISMTHGVTRSHGSGFLSKNFHCSFQNRRRSRHMKHNRIQGRGSSREMNVVGTMHDFRRMTRERYFLIVRIRVTKYTLLKIPVRKATVLQQCMRQTFNQCDAHLGLLMPCLQKRLYRRIKLPAGILQQLKPLL